MGQRAIYRWKGFWLGVFVACFLGWEWVRSMTWEDNFTWRYWETAKKMGIECEHDGISVSQLSGQVRLSWELLDPFAEDGIDRWSVLLESMRPMEALEMPDGSDDPIGRRSSDGASDPFAEADGAAANDPFAPGDAMAADPFAPGAMDAEVTKAGRGPFPKVLDMGEGGVMVTHWLVCVVFLLVWGGWLVWRWRRMNSRGRVLNGEG